MDETNVIEKKVLSEKFEALDTKFNSVSQQVREIELKEAALKSEKQKLNVELFRIQGEHRLLKDLLGIKDDPEAVDKPEEK